MQGQKHISNQGSKEQNEAHFYQMSQLIVLQTQNK